jgi:hypothetical protein
MRSAVAVHERLDTSDATRWATKLVGSIDALVNWDAVGVTGFEHVTSSL